MGKYKGEGIEDRGPKGDKGRGYYILTIVKKCLTKSLHAIKFKVAKNYLDWLQGFRQTFCKRTGELVPA